MGKPVPEENISCYKWITIQLSRKCIINNYYMQSTLYIILYSIVCQLPLLSTAQTLELLSTESVQYMRDCKKILLWVKF